jgi:hypothetical protein
MEKILSSFISSVIWPGLLVVGYKPFKLKIGVQFSFGLPNRFFEN